MQAITRRGRTAFGHLRLAQVMMRWLSVLVHSEGPDKGLGTTEVSNFRQRVKVYLKECEACIDQFEGKVRPKPGKEPRIDVFERVITLHGSE
ncbi:hypothetical protein AAMO2058_001282900 [Amorphochlora amoebiformis]